MKPASAGPAAPPVRLLDQVQMQALALLLAACLIAHSGWLSPRLIVFFAVIGALRVWWHAKLTTAVPQLIRAPLLILTMVIVFTTTGSPLGRDGGAALLLGLAILKLVESRSVRDGRMLVAAVFFIAMSEFLFSQSLTITFYVGAVSIAAFAALSMLRKYPDSHTASQSLPAGVRAAFVAVSRIALAALPLAAAAFLFFPRLGSPLWGAPWRGSEGTTGIGDEMRPGMLSKLWLDDTPVFRVTFDGAMPEIRKLYWRGPVLWNFDGETWSRANWMRGGEVIPFRYSQDSVVSYEVLLEPTERNWYFPLDLALRAAPNSLVLPDGQMMTQRPIISPKRMKLESATEFMFEETPIPGHRWAALQLPADSNPEARRLAARWRAEGKNDNEVIKAALKLYNDSFTYSLEPPILDPERSIDDFLFNTQTGYCEHFASSFAFLMRAAGIPARVITGYQGGYLNRSGNYLLVRNSDAHAWTEVWLEGRGWVRSDPTAAVAPERIIRGSNADALPAAQRWYHASWIAALMERSDRVSRWWRQRIVDFDAMRQRQLLTPFGVSDTQWQHLVVALVVAGTLTLAIGVWWSMRGMRKRVRDPLLRAWKRFGSGLAGAGVKRNADEGPIDFSQRAARALPHHAGSILGLGKEFVRLRYDPGAVEDRDARESLIRALRRFRARARS
jgi:transglutaminase-like putative cysteine protease